MPTIRESAVVYYDDASAADDASTLTLLEPAGKGLTLNLRIRPEDRELIDRAARVRGQNRTEFVLGAARRAAEEALLERTLMGVDAAAFAAFEARLAAAPAPNARLCKTMQTPPPWGAA